MTGQPAGWKTSYKEATHRLHKNIKQTQRTNKLQEKPIIPAHKIKRVSIILPRTFMKNSLGGHNVQCGAIDEAHGKGQKDQIADCEVQIAISKSMFDEISTSRFGHDQIHALHYDDCEQRDRRYLMIQTLASTICLQGREVLNTHVDRSARNSPILGRTSREDRSATHHTNRHAGQSGCAARIRYCPCTQSRS